MKKIWILNHYATEMFYNKGGRHHYFAKYLIKAGYDVTIFCASARHNGGDNLIKDGRLYYSDEVEGIPYIFVKTRDYKGNGKSRVLNMLDYYFNVKKTASNFPKPDVIIGSSVHPLACVAAINLSKKFKCKNIVEIRDLWPESIFEFSNLKKNGIIGKLLQLGEKWIYKKANKIIFTFEGGYDYIKEQNWDGKISKGKCFYVNNGVDLEVFDRNKRMFKLEDKELDDKSTFKVIYTGAICIVNKVDCLIDAAKLIKNKNIKILIYGDGTELNRLKKRLIDENISNVIFKDKVDKKYIPYILSKADLNTYILEKIPLYRFGLSLNKSFEYFASGKPVLATANSGYSIIDKYKCGKCLEVYSAKNYANAIEAFVNMAEEKYENYCKNAKAAGLDFDFEILTKQLIKVME